MDENIDESTIEKNKLLLKLSLHRYDEEERRNELIDNKNKSLVAFLGVILTIQCTLLPSILGLYNNIPILYFFILVLSFIGSIIRFVISMMYFITALNYGSFSSVPDMTEIIEFKEHDVKINEVISDSIDNLKYAIDKNKELMNEKTDKGKQGFHNLKIGVIFTLCFIVLFLLTFVW